MNTKLYKYIILFVLTSLAVPMMAQDYMNIYLKDGMCRTFYLEDVNEMNVSKYDLDGQERSDNNYQHITTINGEYVYSLVDVDSITFTKFDEETVEKNLSSVMTTLSPILGKSKTIDDVKKNINTIKESEGVEDAWYSNNDLFVKVEGWETMAFHMNHDEGNEFGSIHQTRILENIKGALSRMNSIMKPDGSKLKIVIANQQHNDENGYRIQCRDYLFTPLIYELVNYGVDATYLDKPDLDFFYSDIYGYDVVFLITHGMFSEQSRMHSFITSDELGTADFESEEIDPALWRTQLWRDRLWRVYRRKAQFKGTTTDHFYVNWVKEIRDGKELWVAYPCVTELFFKEFSQGNFINSNSIFFNGACQSLMGKDGTASYSMAEIFRGHNLGTYIGYTESNSCGQLCGTTFLTHLFNGKSVGKSFNDLENATFDFTNLKGNYHKEDHTEYNKDKSTKQYTALLKMFPEHNETANSVFLFPTITVEKSQESMSKDYSQRGTIVLEGITSFYDVSKDVIISKMGITDNTQNAIKCGIEYGTNEYVQNRKIDANIFSTSYEGEGGNCLFKATLKNLELGTYYYRAFVFDGLNYNYGKRCSFTLYPDLQVAAQKLELEKGEKVSFTITAGSGEYSVESSDKSVAKANVVGNEVYIEAISGGKDVTITVTDTKSGQKATVTVIVISYGPPLSVGDSFIADGVTYMVTSIKPLEVQVGNCEEGSGVESAIVWYMRDERGDFTIPSKVKGTDGNIYSVTRLGRYSFEECSFTSVTIPSSVTSIGKNAFFRCSGLTSIKIPESVTSIENHAFYECSGLTSIKIPESVISIGDLAFYGCSGLYSIIIPKSVNSIGYFAFTKCSYLHTVIILCSPTNVNVSSRIFEDCNNITEAVFDCRTVTPILGYQTSLKRVTLKESVTTIEDHAFYGCSNLNTITISNSVTSIGDVAFFKCTGLKSITIPNSVITIGKEAFRACESLSTVKIGNNVTSIGEGAFLECIGLITVTIGNNVTSIGDFAFFQCGSLKSVNIPGSVRSIGCFAFKDCSSLNSITIPKGVSFIDSGAFRNCSALAAIYAEATEPIKVEYWLFEGVDTDNCVLYVPKGCVDKYRGATAWGNFKKIVEH